MWVRCRCARLPAAAAARAPCANRSYARTSCYAIRPSEFARCKPRARSRAPFVIRQLARAGAKSCVRARDSRGA
eukprot:10660403-Lingulodinium_polyedra.AAC.1